MAARREKFSSQAAPELLAAVREIARQDGRHFRAVLEDALRQYIQDGEGPKDHSQEKVRPEIMAHFRARVEKNRRLGELLAQCPSFPIAPGSHRNAQRVNRYFWRDSRHPR